MPSKATIAWENKKQIAIANQKQQFNPKWKVKFEAEFSQKICNGITHNLLYNILHNLQANGMEGINNNQMKFHVHIFELAFKLAMDHWWHLGQEQCQWADASGCSSTSMLKQYKC